jgi:hypothetical protein
MTPADAKKVLRHMLVGFGIGLVVMVTVSYGATSLGGSPPAVSTSAK